MYEAPLLFIFINCLTVREQLPSLTILDVVTVLLKQIIKVTLTIISSLTIVVISRSVFSNIKIKTLSVQD